MVDPADVSLVTDYVRRGHSVIFAVREGADAAPAIEAIRKSVGELGRGWFTLLISPWMYHDVLAIYNQDTDMLSVMIANTNISRPEQWSNIPGVIVTAVDVDDMGWVDLATDRQLKAEEEDTV